MYNWMPSEDQLAQTSHFFIATTIIAYSHLLGQKWWFGLLAVLVWATFKEWIFDIIVEGDTIAGSLEDFVWYMIGEYAEH